MYTGIRCFKIQSLFVQHIINVDIVLKFKILSRYLYRGNHFVVVIGFDRMTGIFLFNRRRWQAIFLFTLSVFVVPDPERRTNGVRKFISYLMEIIKTGQWSGTLNISIHNPKSVVLLTKSATDGSWVTHSKRHRLIWSSTWIYSNT